MAEQTTDRREEPGFTLVELLIVIVVLGLLSTVAVMRLHGITEESKATACQMEEREVDAAIQLYRTQHGGAAPATVADLVPGFLRRMPSEGSGAGTGTYDAVTGEFTASNC